jgi:hypothetical protein
LISTACILWDLPYGEDKLKESAGTITQERHSGSWLKFKINDGHSSLSYPIDLLFRVLDFLKQLKYYHKSNFQADLV